MQVGNKQLILTVIVILSILLNVYFLVVMVDTGITKSDTNMELQYRQQEKEDALLVINEMLSNISETDFNQLIKKLKQQKDEPVVKQEVNSISINNIVFTQNKPLTIGITLIHLQSMHINKFRKGTLPTVL